MRQKIVGIVFSVLLGCCAVFTVGAGTPAHTSDEAKVGLVLSGGGARGLAHIGVLKALEELCIPVDCITATSMGALVGGGYAAGYTASEIEHLTLGIDWKTMFASRPDRREMKWRAKEDDDASLGRTFELGVTKEGLRTPGGLISGQELTLFLNRSVQFADSVRNLSELPIPFSALATDLLTGKRVVLSRNIALSKAMLASMSIPGAFTPVKYRGKLLCDGCLVDNLPVDVARDMGAKRLIAVNVGTPLSDAVPLENIPQIMAQVVNILTEQNVRKSLSEIGRDDVLITPVLEDYTAADFSKTRELIDIGYKAVMNEKERLASFRVTPEAYARWRAEKKILTGQASERRINRIEVRGNRTVSRESIIKEADLDTSQPVSVEDVEKSVRRLWGTERFEKVSYRFRTGEYGDTLIYEPEEWAWGQSSLKFGGMFQTDFIDISRYSVVGAYTLGSVNAWDAEWRTHVQFGDKRYLYTEFFQPLGAGSPWFVRPFVGLDQQNYDVYFKETGNHVVSQMKSMHFESGLDLGVELARRARLVASLGWERTSYSTLRGTVQAPDTERRWTGAVDLAYDTLDDVNFPRTGAKAEFRYSHALAGKNGYAYDFQGVLPVALSQNWTAVLATRLGKSSQSGYYTMGGLFSLSGAPEDRYAGEKLIFGAARLSRRIDAMVSSPMPLYAGITIEGARLSNNDRQTWTHQDGRWIGAASLFLGADTWLGPVFLGLGRTTEDSMAVTLYWGRVSWW